MKRFCCILFALCALLSITACDLDDDYQISYDLSGGPANLDPQTAADHASLIVIQNIFEGLYTLDEEGSPQPAVAQSAEVSPDGLTYLFALDPAAQWRYVTEDGEEEALGVTADDFVFAFRRLLTPATNSPAASRFVNIKNGDAVLSGELDPAQLGVYADGPHTLRVELEKPDETFFTLLASTYAMPCNESFFLETMGRYGLESSTIMANGPFHISSWLPDSAVRLERNPFYRDVQSVLPSGVTLRITEAPGGSSAASSNPSASSQPDPVLSRLEQGYTDAALVDGSCLPFLKEGKYERKPVENAVWGLYLNTQQPVLANSHMRLAISYAFDRSTYQPYLPENLSVTSALLPHGISLFGKNYRQAAGDPAVQRFDPEQAFQSFKTGLSELNRDGYGELTLLYADSSGISSAEYFSHASQILQKEISLFLKLEPVSQQEFDRRVSSGDFDIALIRLSSEDNTPWSILERFLSGSSQNVTGYHNAAFDEAMRAAAAAGTAETAIAQYAAAETALLQDAVFLPMYYSTDYFVTQPGVTGIVYNPQTGLVSFQSAAFSR